MPTYEVVKRRYGISFPTGSQPPPTEIHPPTSSDRYREAKAEVEAYSISFLVKLYQAIAPSTAAVTVQYFRRDQFSFGLLPMKSKIDDLIFSLGFYIKLIY